MTEIEECVHGTQMCPLPAKVNKDITPEQISGRGVTIHFPQAIRIAIFDMYYDTYHDTFYRKLTIP